MENWRRYVLPRFASLSCEAPAAPHSAIFGVRRTLVGVASCSTIIGGSFVLRWFVRLRPQQENGKGKPVSSAATDGRMAQEGRGEEEEERRRWLWRRRRFPSLPLELGGSSSRSSLFRSLSRSHAAERLSDPVLKIDGGSVQLSFSIPPSSLVAPPSSLPSLDSMIPSFPFRLLLPLRAALEIVESAIAS